MKLPAVMFDERTEPYDTWARIVLRLSHTPLQLRLHTGEEVWVQVTDVIRDDMGTPTVVGDELAWPSLDVARTGCVWPVHALAAVVVV